MSLAGYLVDDIRKAKEQEGDLAKLYAAIVERRLKEIYISDAMSLLTLRFCDFAGVEKALLDEKKYVMIM